MTPYKNVILSQDLGRKRFWYIHGTEPALVTDAVELARSHIECAPFSTAVSVFTGDQVDQTELEHRLLSPVLEDRSLVILYESNRYPHWDRLLRILQSLPAKCFFISVSDDPDLDRSTEIGTFFSKSGKARLVTCTELAPDILIYWLETRLSIRRDACRFLIAKSNGNMEWLLSTVRKLEYLTGTLTLELLEKVLTTEGTPDMALSLLSFDKRAALVALDRELQEDAPVGIIKSIRDAALLNAGAKAAGNNPRLLFEKTRLSTKRVAFLKKFSKFYDRKNTFRTSNLMFNSYSMLRSGNKAAWQSIISRW